MVYPLPDKLHLQPNLCDRNNMHTNETRIYITVLAGIAILAFLMIVFIASIIRYQRKKVAAHLETIKWQINFFDSERERIAADLHDDLGSSLSAIKIRLQTLKNLEPHAASVISFSKTQIDEAMQKLRNTSFNLMPKILLKQGVGEALGYLVDIMTYGTTVKVHYHCSVTQLEKHVSLHVYRISQEILNNILKHSGATEVNFRITENGKIITLQITDNGKGFDKNLNGIRSKGSGLKNIVARADLLRAKIFLTTAPGKGVDYIIEIPV